MSANKPIFSSAADVEAAFYEALERGDVDTMMSVWAEDEEIVCVLPAGPRLAGYAAIREAWRRLFERGSRFRIRMSRQSTAQNPFSVIHNNVEELTVIDERQQSATIIATNVFVRGPLGWRLLLHHASPASGETIAEIPKVLH
jgi:ketosteroid isomerase-like protein